MKSLDSLRVALAVLENAGLLCGVNVGRDAITLRDRYEHEGEGFLTLTLPAYCRAFERSLGNEQIDPGLWRGYFPVRGGRPTFLQGFLDRVFERRTGRISPDADIDCIRAIRQITLWFGKLFEVCDERRMRASVEAYVEIESSLAGVQLDEDVLRELGDVAAKHFGDALTSIDQSVHRGEVVGSHGPGATADGFLGNEKFHIRRWTARLERWLPAGEVAMPFYGYFRELAHMQFDDSPGTEIPVRVTPVPKTAGKARIIAIEPTHMQFAQQGLLRLFVAEFSGKAPFIDLHDQEPNQVLARKGSRDGSVATLDLSEASDRVSLRLVQAVFRHYPSLLGALEATRTQRAQLPDGRVIDLRKFASMGSAVCFPVEAIVFATICLLAERRYVDSSSQKVSLCRSALRVFGDDITVDTRLAPSCVELLEACGLKVNLHKSFWSGSFRESCGKEYFAGHDVTVARLRKRIPSRRRQARELASLVAFRNHLYTRGFWMVARMIDEELEKFGPMPIVDPSSALLGRQSVCFGWRAQKWSKDTQSPLVRGLYLVAQPPKSLPSEIGALCKCLSPERLQPFDDDRHLERAGRPRFVRIKIGWVQPF